MKTTVEDESSHDFSRTLRPETPLNEHKEFIKLARRKLVAQGLEGTEDLRYHVDAATFADCAQISINDVQMLVDTGSLKPLNNTSVLRDQLFDLRMLASFIKHLSNVNHPGPTSITVTAESLILKSHFARYGALLGAVLNGEIRGCIQSTQAFRSITVVEDDLKCWLRAQLNKACSEPISMNRVMKALECGESTLRQHVRDGHFTWARWRNTGKEWVDGPSLYRYLTTEAEFCQSQEV